MATYIETVVKKHPEYKNRNFLLSNKDKNQLFSKNGNHIEISINGRSRLTASKVDANLKRHILDIDSLRKIGTEFLHLNDPSVPQMLKCLVLPEMEVERIFNSLRYKYLQAVYDSEFDRPFRLFDASCNEAFQSMAGINIYQGGTKDRKSNDYFWKEKKFKRTVKALGWEMEQDALGFILSYIRRRDSQCIDKSYLELIAIKPGFHELWIHNKYFEYYYKEKTTRNIALNILKGESKRSLLNLKHYPKEINKKDYLSFASCNVTEGPFVYRKNIAIEYFQEIRKIGSPEQLTELQKKFHILDYYPPHNMIGSKADLELFLKKAEKFTKFM